MHIYSLVVDRKINFKMPTVEEVDFEEEEYDTEDEEDEEEEFSLVDKVSDSVSAALGGLKRYATPVWKYGGPLLWAISTTSLLVVLPLMMEVQKEQAMEQEMQKQELAAQNQGPSGNAAGVLPGPLNNGNVAPMQ